MFKQYRQFILVVIPMMLVRTLTTAEELPKNEFPLDLRLEAIDKIWGPEYEPDIERTALWVPRVIGNVVQYTLGSQSATRARRLVVDVPLSIFAESASSPELNKNLYHAFTESVLNPLMLVNSAVSDIISLPLVSLTARSTDLTQVCFSHLVNHDDDTRYSLLGLISPIQHIEVRNVNAYGDQLTENKEKRICLPIPILDNQSALRALLRLHCAHNATLKKSKIPDYSILKHNCGAKTQFFLNAAGLGFPAFPNLGIGVDSFHTEDREALQQMTQSCLLFADFAYEALRGIESGRVLTETEKKFIVEKTEIENDLFKARFFDPRSPLTLVFFLAAARGKREENRQMITYAWMASGASLYGTPRPFRLGSLNWLWWAFRDPNWNKDDGINGRLPNHYRADFEKLFYGIDQEAFEWLSNVVPWFKSVYNSLFEAKSPREKFKITTYQAPEAKSAEITLGPKARDFEIYYAKLDKRIKERKWIRDLPCTEKSFRSDSDDCVQEWTNYEVIAKIGVHYTDPTHETYGDTEELPLELDSLSERARDAILKNETSGMNFHRAQKRTQELFELVSTEKENGRIQVIVREK